MNKEFNKETALFVGHIFWEFRWNQKKRKVNERKIKENKRKIKGIKKLNKGKHKGHVKEIKREMKEREKEIKGKIKDLKGKLKKMKRKMKGGGCCEIIFPEKKINKRKTKISNNTPKRFFFQRHGILLVCFWHSQLWTSWWPAVAHTACYPMS